MPACTARLPAVTAAMSVLEFVAKNMNVHVSAGATFFVLVAVVF